MKAVHKFPLDTFIDRQGQTEIQMDPNAKLLYVGQQDGTIMLWAEVDPEAPTIPKAFFVKGTGHYFEDNPLAYVGTVQMPGGLVWHVYHKS
jgi:hypothetical protein